MLSRDEAIERRIEGRCAVSVMVVSVLSESIRTLQTMAYDNAVMQEKINQHHSSSCLAARC